MPETAAPIIDLEHTGGIVTVVLAKDIALPAPYDNHPRVFSIQAHDLPQIRDELSSKIPTTTKLVLVAGEIPSGTFSVLRRVLEDRQLVYLSRRNPTALVEALRRTLTKKEDTPPSPLKARLRAPLEEAVTNINNVVNMRQPNRRVGAVAALLQEADLSKGSAEEGRRLLRIAQARGISTTANSLATGIAALKRKGGRTETPKSLMSEQQRVLIVFDEALDAARQMIAKLTVVRDYVEKTEQESVKLSNKMKEFQALAAMVAQDIPDSGN